MFTRFAKNAKKPSGLLRQFGMFELFVLLVLLMLLVKNLPFSSHCPPGLSGLGGLWRCLYAAGHTCSHPEHRS